MCRERSLVVASASARLCSVRFHSFLYLLLDNQTSEISLRRRRRGIRRRRGRRRRSKCAEVVLLSWSPGNQEWRLPKERKRFGSSVPVLLARLSLCVGYRKLAIDRATTPPLPHVSNKARGKCEGRGKRQWQSKSKSKSGPELRVHIHDGYTWPTHDVVVAFIPLDGWSASAASCRNNLLLPPLLLPSHNCMPY